MDKEKLKIWLESMRKVYDNGNPTNEKTIALIDTLTLMIEAGIFENKLT